VGMDFFDIPRPKSVLQYH